MKEEDFLEWNEEMFKKYTNERLYFHPNPIVRYTENKRVSLVLNAIKARKSDKILEVGCGEAYVLRKIKNGVVVGIDISDAALKYAKKRLKEDNNAKILLLRADAQKMPFKDNSFDKIICTELLEHVTNPEKVIEEIARISKINGTIVLTIPNELLINKVKDLVLKVKLYDLLLKDVPKRMNCEWHLHSFRLNLLKKIVRGKLKINGIKTAPFCFIPIRYIAICKKEGSEDGKTNI
jgi:ubiquinone/menaquinone biosynthesis C-methylase UbiE